MYFLISKIYILLFSRKMYDIKKDKITSTNSDIVSLHACPGSPTVTKYSSSNQVT